MRVKLYFYDMDTPVSRQEYLFLQTLIPSERLSELDGKREAFAREAVFGEVLTRFAAWEFRRMVKRNTGNYEVGNAGAVRLEKLKEDLSARLSEELSSRARSWMKNLVIEKHEKGKKFFRDYPEIHFNISHSGHWMVCAVSDHEIGVDIEKPEKKQDVMKIAKRFFHAREVAALEVIANENPMESKKEFQRLWTMKEAYLKCVGEGLSGGMDGYWFELNGASCYEVRSDAGVLPFEVVQFAWKDGYECSVCYELPVTFDGVKSNDRGDGK